MNLTCIPPYSSTTIDKRLQHIFQEEGKKELQEAEEELRSMVDETTDTALKADLTLRLQWVGKLLAPSLVSYDNGFLTVAGGFPTASEVMAVLPHRPIYSCIAIFGFHTITFDQDLIDDKLKTVSLIFVARRVHFVGEPKIILSGKHMVADFRIPSTEPSPPGAPGVPGYTGFPGQNAGHCFGFGHMTGLDKLRIECNGGNGSAGQSGRNGGDGRHGVDGAYEDKPFTQGGKWDYVGPLQWQGHQVHMNYGTKGQAGGDAGVGGHGGEAGPAGRVEVYNLDNPSQKAMTENNYGEWGISGLSGKPGEGGKHGSRVQGVWNFFINNWIVKPSYYEEGRAVRGKYNAAPDWESRIPVFAPRPPKTEKILEWYQEAAEMFTNPLSEPTVKLFIDVFKNYQKNTERK